MNKAQELTKMGFDLQDRGKLKEALSHFLKAIEIDPDFADAYTGMGNIFISFRQMEKALASFLNAFNYYLDSKEKAKLDYVCRHLAYIYRENGKYPQAKRFLEYCFGNGTEYEKAILMPAIYQSTKEIASHRQRALKELQEMKFDFKSEFLPSYTHFYLSYHGKTDDRIYHEIIYDKLKPFYPESICNWKKRNNPAKIKIGIVSTYFYNHSVSHCYANLIKHLNNDPAFEVYVISTISEGDDWTQKIRDNCHKFVVIESDLINARYTIKKLRLDVIGYLDIGMDTFTYQLAFTRMAPVTMVFGGHPVTTGIKTIDYFVSSKLFHDYQVQYTETLIKVDGLMTDYDRPTFNLVPREKIEQMPSGNVYTCPMTIFKVHPDMDHILRLISEQDPDATFLFFKFGDAGVHHELAKRIKSNAPGISDKVFFRDWADKDEFMSVMHHSKAVLDTLYFGAGNTSYAAMAAGTPIITFCPDNPELSSARNSNTMAHYKQLDAANGTDYVKRYVAWDWYDYAKKAVAVNEKLGNVDAIFNDSTGIMNFIEGLKKLHGKEG